jgi:poly(3-hydroxybutyrate) depolymerase
VPAPTKRLLLAALAGSLAITAHGAESISVAISPASATVKVPDTAHKNAGKQQFKATVTGTWDTGVLWSICHGSTCYETGAWSQFGSIDLEGVFTAPFVLPNPTTLQIKATAIVDPDQSATATVTIDRNVDWRVSQGTSIDTPAPDWKAMQKPGEHQVYYHVLHDGQQETCQPSTTGPEVGPCYRQVIFHVGKGYQPGNGAVFFFHGAGGRIENCKPWKDENDKHGWITVCIQGIHHGGFGPSNQSRSWNSYWASRKGTPVAPEATPDDSALAWAIAKDLVDRLGVSPKRVHATGHSAGLTMVAQLLTDNGALFASVAQGPGNMYASDHRVCFGERESCNPASKFPQVHAFEPFGFGIPNINYPSSVLIMMGTVDKFTPFCGAHNNSPNGDEAFWMYATMFHCRTREPNDKPMCPYVPGQSPKCQESKFFPGVGRACAPSGEIYKNATDCDNGVVVSSYPLVNGEHRWEPTDVSDPANPIHNTRLRTDFPNAVPPKASGSQTAIVWDFFNRNPKP